MINPFLMIQFSWWKRVPKLKMQQLICFSSHKPILGHYYERKWFHNSLAQFSYPFPIIGSSWSRKVKAWIWCDWSTFYHMKQIWIEKSIYKGLKMIWMNFCARSWSITFIHSWWSLPLGEKESETEKDAIDLFFTL